mmetsp:Transcript_5742/g.17103  ORF Transcript_5742/g.17103 Transcript_5742/m.17103 type:complete len:169 (-) Transcript_5742:141-647(-)
MEAKKAQQTEEDRQIEAGFRFYKHYQDPVWQWLYKYTGIYVSACGRREGKRCYYVEGVEGDERYETAVKLAADLVERFEEIRSFAKPSPVSKWPSRHAELRKGIKEARDHSGPVLVYEGCVSPEEMRKGTPPCYQYIGNLAMFEQYIRETHQYDWNIRKLKGFGRNSD